MIALGNPGSGKSTLLNSLAGEFLFESGLSIGKGLTKELGKKKNNIATFLDTPGLDDPKLRKDAVKVSFHVFSAKLRMKKIVDHEVPSEIVFFQFIFSEN